jgi:hypothetical protein
MAIQVPAQSFMPIGHAGTQTVPLQVTPPPIGASHATHEDAPQLPMSPLFTHRPPQMWYPVAHARVHAPPTHCAVPFGSVAQAVHAAPHAVVSSSRTHLVPHL